MKQLHASDVVEWAVDRWNSEVKNRPLRNIHRRTLDDSWRQVIRQFGGDDEMLCGPRHDDLVAADPEAARRTAMPQATPSGWKLMPKEPTRDLYARWSGRFMTFQQFSENWRDMLAASPPAPVATAEALAQRLAEAIAKQTEIDNLGDTESIVLMSDTAALNLVEIAEALLSEDPWAHLLTQDALKDPHTVHINMVRGAIAIPSLRQYLHAVGGDALEAVERVLEIAARNEAAPEIERVRELLSLTPDRPETAK